MYTLERNTTYTLRNVPWQMTIMSSQLTKWHRDKLAAFSRRHFEMHFLEEKNKNFAYEFTEFCSKVWIDNIPTLIQIIAWRHPGDEALFEPMVFSYLTHICVTWPEWVKPELGKKAYMCRDMVLVYVVTHICATYHSVRVNCTLSQ